MSDQLLNCLSCDLEFSQSKALIEHLNLAHLPKKVFLHKCSKCPKEFISRQFLDKHKSVHEEKMAQEFLHKCSKCPKEFISRQFLDKHKSVHEEKMAQDKGGIILESIFN